MTENAYIFVLVLLGVVVGIVIISAAGFCFFLLRAINTLSESCKAIQESLKVGVSKQGIENALKAVVFISVRMPQLLASVESMSKVMGMFTDLMFQKQATTGKTPPLPTTPPPAESFAPPGADHFSAITDEQQADHEMTEILRKAGYEVDDKMGPVVPTENMVGKQS